ncbi:alpha/beta fold hydrolase [uncultured Thiodictyon sp.]|uniref:alpha/beta hydrolase n=1 Tax=uncultured Thiodictyon sp. TaxID=1846217 RepID=UPI0025FD1666|nr:alpha/beta fold hydrolase [uncultured Thiodictyon sp.]
MNRNTARWFALLLVLCLSGCAGPLERLPPVSTKLDCAADGMDCLGMARTRFANYHREKLAEIMRHRNGYTRPSQPVAYFHDRRTRYSVLLIHGVTDSAYYMADVAESLYGLGLNVVTVLLPGHGADSHAMLTVRAEQWRSEVDRGLEMARLAGERVIVGGFSLGAALTIDAQLRQTDIAGLLLFAPAIVLRSYDSVLPLTCVPGLRSVVTDTPLHDNPVKYKSRYLNALCQLTRVLAANLRPVSDVEDAPVTTREKLRALAERIRVPTFIAFSYADERIAPAAALELGAHIPAPVMVATFGSGTAPSLGQDGEFRSLGNAPLRHSCLIRRTNCYNGQANPCYEQMIGALSEFLARHFEVAGGAATAVRLPCDQTPPPGC